MVASIATGALLGVEAYRVDVEVSLVRGLPNVFIIGLPDGAVREARMRVENALKALGLEMPSKRVTISLAPSGRRKTGAAYDLPIAVGLLAAAGTVPERSVRGLAFAGELALDGSLRPIRGALALARLARAEGLRGLVVPVANAREAACIEGLEVFGAEGLGTVIAHLTGAAPLAPSAPPPAEDEAVDGGLDLADVRGQALARRALVLAAAGGHHLLLLGPPGTGKTMLARRLPGLLPPLTPDEALEVTAIYSAAGLLGETARVRRRPFRAPHHTASQAALVGGGASVVRVGELSLAHHGVLFLDEAAEIPRPTLDALRQPLERGEVSISRADLRVRLPARAQLVAAMNPCPCGYRWVDAPRPCTCPEHLAQRYLGRLSGPLVDRIDLQVGVDPVPLEALDGPPLGPTTAEARAQVIAARAIQRRRFAGRPGPPLNAWMGPAQLRRHGRLSRALRARLHAGARRLGLSARGVDRVLRVARTAADLAGRGEIALEDLLEALTYREMERALRAGDPFTPSSRPGRRGDHADGNQGDAQAARRSRR